MGYSRNFHTFLLTFCRIPVLKHVFQKILHARHEFSSMNKLTVLVILSICSVRAQQYGWVRATQLPHPLETVDFVDSLHGWTADVVTGFYYTRDGGSSWQP